MRNADKPVGVFSPAMGKADRAIKDFLNARMYRHARIMRIMDDAQQVISDLFGRYVTEPQLMPKDWAHPENCDDPAIRSRRIADFIAGMTDRYAIIEHARLFDTTPELR